MSTIIMSQCWPLQMAPPKKAVLVSLADNANDQGVCWPSVASIALRTCLSERTVQMAIAWLLANHYLRISDRAGRSSVYQIVVPEKLDVPANRATPPHHVHPRTPCTPAGDAPHPRTTCTPPPHEVHPTPAPHAPHPRTTCTLNRKGTIKEPSENHQGTAIGQATGLADGLPPPPPPPPPKAASTDLDLSALPEISPAVWSDYLLHRKRKRAPLTQSALSMLASELHQAVAAGWTADNALAEAMAMGWTGFKLEWLQRAAGRGAGSSTAGRRIQPETEVKRHRRTFFSDMADIAEGRPVGDSRTLKARTVDVQARPLF